MLNRTPAAQVRLLTVAAVLLLFACESPPQSAEVALVHPSTTLPVLGDPDSPGQQEPFGCSEDNQPREISVCDWMGSIDSLVWGEVTAVRFPTAPSVRRTAMPFPQPPRYVVADDCEAGPPAIEFDIDIEGQVGAMQATSLTIRAGFRYRARMVPKPVARYDGSTAFFVPPQLRGDLTRPHEQVLQANRPIAVGSRVAFPVTYVEEWSIWTPLGEPPIYIDDSGDARFQFLLDVDHDVPRSGLFAFQELVDQAAACVVPSVAAEKRRERMAHGYGPNGSQNEIWFIAGRCSDHDPPAPERCFSELGCSDTRTCNRCTGRCFLPAGPHCLDSSQCGDEEVCDPCTATCM